MFRIACYTLFDITQTGVMNRSKPTQDDIENWVSRRNTQCNFDTILQVISLRSQPEIAKFPVKTEMNEEDYKKFGFIYNKQDGQISYYWKFEIEIQHMSVFENEFAPLGALYNDCEGVPMIICNTQTEKTSTFLDTSVELKNIHFETV